MSAYLDVTGFKSATVAPASYVDAIENEEPGWTAGRLQVWSRWIDARLRKRYAAPFASPPPDTVLGWLSAIMTWEVYLKRGVNALDAQIVEIKAASTEAKAEVVEAATATTGLFDLPLRANTTESGITAPGPQSLTEISPYTWQDAQIEQIDANGERER